MIHYIDTCIPAHISLSPSADGKVGLVLALVEDFVGERKTEHKLRW